MNIAETLSRSHSERTALSRVGQRVSSRPRDVSCHASTCARRSATLALDFSLSLSLSLSSELSDQAQTATNATVVPPSRALTTNATPQNDRNLDPRRRRGEDKTARDETLTAGIRRPRPTHQPARPPDIPTHVRPRGDAPPRRARSRGGTAAARQGRAGGTTILPW